MKKIILFVNLILSSNNRELYELFDTIDENYLVNDEIASTPLFDLEKIIFEDCATFTEGDESVDTNKFDFESFKILNKNNLMEKKEISDKYNEIYPDNNISLIQYLESHKPNLSLEGNEAYENLSNKEIEYSKANYCKNIEQFQNLTEKQQNKIVNEKSECEFINVEKYSNHSNKKFIDEKNEYEKPNTYTSEIDNINYLEYPKNNVKNYINFNSYEIGNSTPNEENPLECDFIRDLLNGNRFTESNENTRINRGSENQAKKDIKNQILESDFTDSFGRNENFLIDRKRKIMLDGIDYQNCIEEINTELFEKHKPPKILKTTQENENSFTRDVANFSNSSESTKLPFDDIRVISNTENEIGSHINLEKKSETMKSSISYILVRISDDLSDFENLKLIKEQYFKDIKKRNEKSEKNIECSNKIQNNDKKTDIVTTEISKENNNLNCRKKNTESSKKSIKKIQKYEFIVKKNIGSNVICCDNPKIGQILKDHKIYKEGEINDFSSAIEFFNQNLLKKCYFSHYIQNNKKKYINKFNKKDNIFDLVEYFNNFLEDAVIEDYKNLENAISHYLQYISNKKRHNSTLDSGNYCQNYFMGNGFRDTYKNAIISMKKIFPENKRILEVFGTKKSDRSKNYSIRYFIWSLILNLSEKLTGKLLKNDEDIFYSDFTLEFFALRHSLRKLILNVMTNITKGTKKVYFYHKALLVDEIIMECVKKNDETNLNVFMRDISNTLFKYYFLESKPCLYKNYESVGDLALEFAIKYINNKSIKKITEFKDLLALNCKN